MGGDRDSEHHPHRAVSERGGDRFLIRGPLELGHRLAVEHLVDVGDDALRDVLNAGLPVPAMVENWWPLAAGQHHLGRPSVNDGT